MFLKKSPLLIAYTVLDWGRWSKRSRFWQIYFYWSTIKPIFGNRYMLKNHNLSLGTVRQTRSGSDVCSAGKRRIAGKRHNLRGNVAPSPENDAICWKRRKPLCRDMSHCWREMSQEKSLPAYVAHRREMSQLLLILNFDNLLKRKHNVN